VTGGPASPPSVSVVVSARDEEAQIATCLASLISLAYPETRREILVVDDGSRDRTAEIVRGQAPAARLLSTPRRGVAVARNHGIEAAEGELVAFTDPDCSVAKTWLDELTRAFSEPSVGAAAGSIVPFPPRTKAELWAARRRSHNQLVPLAHPARSYAMTPNLAVRRDVLRRLGGFDPCFPGGGWEDADLCWRLSLESALELRYAPQAVVFHRYRDSAGELLAQHYRYGYGLGVLRRKYPDELPWGWRQRARAYAEMARALGGMAAAGMQAITGRGGRDPTLACFDVLRAVGQRSGFLAASVIGGRR
jgi:GT2 family glycosyltransferase